ncbi:GNAT family N-acetyltransferase [Metabacillus litoralis]|uniref:GNAT family N-acetyltransferase n=1 Tax=Metabacillus litoralis TaxID=152268 RepID=UPI000EF60CF8|nr:GNAT family N-acetyltransferase [Metabacillus litoralis]
MEFIPIDLNEHRDYVIQFRKDSFIVSFGSDDDFGSEEDYLDWLKQQSEKYPEGFVLAVENQQPIGQLELTLKEFDGKQIGYVNLYYLISGKRGKGYGTLLHNYALTFFKNNGVNEYHLRVSPTNHNAISFYIKNGMKKINTEMIGKVLRFSGNLPC